MLKNILIGLILCCSTALASDGDTTLETARAAVKANTATHDGIAFDGKIGKEFGKKYSQAVFQCVQEAGDDLENFTFYFRLAKDGTVAEVLEDRRTNVSECLRKDLIKARFSRPPRPDYWLDIQMTLKQ